MSSRTRAYLHTVWLHVLYHVTVYFLMSAPLSAHAQRQEINDRIRYWQEKALEYAPPFTDSALISIEHAKALLNQSSDKSLEASIWASDGALRLKAGQFMQSEKSLITALNLIKRYGISEGGIESDVRINLGSTYLHRQDFATALSHYLKAQQSLDEQARPDQAMKCYNNMGIVHSRLDNQEKAKAYFKKAVNVNEGKGDKILILNALANLAGLYQEEKNYDSALETALEAKKIALKHRRYAVLSAIYTNISIIHQENNRLEEALAYGIKSLDVKKKYGLRGLAIAYNNVGYTYFLKGDYDAALRHYRKGLHSAKGMERLSLLRNLKAVNRALGHLSAALDYADAYTDLKDSLEIENHRKNVAELTERYQAEKKQHQINQLSLVNEQQRDRIKQQYLISGSLVFTLLMLSGLFYLIYRQNQIKGMLRSTQLKQQLLRAQLNPHFIFHALNSIQNYLYDHKAEDSADYLARFGKLMRYILVHADQEVVPVTEDADMLDQYLKLQQLNHEYRFDYHIHVQEDIEESMFLIPTLLTQPFVENAILHGLNQKEDGKLDIRYTLKKNHLQIDIIDNGTGIPETIMQEGRDANRLYRSKSGGIITQRLELLEKTYHKKAVMEVKEAYPDNADYPGTQVILTIPSIENISAERSKER